MAMLNDHAPRPHATKSSSSHHPTVAKVSDVIANYRPVKCFRREENEEAKSISVVSLDFDDPGELLMTAQDDDTIKLYSVKAGTFSRNILSKKYGVKLAKFMHSSSCILYASTKGDHAIRYMTTHDSAFIRYFKGHEKAVTCLAVHPGDDEFISCSMDNTVRIWNANSSNPRGRLDIEQPYLAAFDPSASVIAIATHAVKSLLLYDFRNFHQKPFATFDILTVIHTENLGPQMLDAEWTKIEFSNDGKSLLLATTAGHLVLDAFSGQMKVFLARPKGGTNRLAPGVLPQEDGYGPRVESSGDTCFTQDGRYVVGGSGSENVYVWDTNIPSMNKSLESTHTLEFKAPASVLAFNPRYNFFASADKEVVMWAPDF